MVLKELTDFNLKKPEFNSFYFGKECVGLESAWI